MAAAKKKTSAVPPHVILREVGVLLRRLAGAVDMAAFQVKMLTPKAPTGKAVRRRRFTVAHPSEARTRQ